MQLEQQVQLAQQVQSQVQRVLLDQRDIEVLLDRLDQKLQDLQDQLVLQERKVFKVLLDQLVRLVLLERKVFKD